MTRWSRLPAALLAAGASMAAVGTLPATAFPATMVPNTAAGIVKIFHSPGIRFISNDPTTNGAITAGPDNAVWFTNPGNNTIGRISPAGYVKDYAGSGIADPYGITTGPDGALWFDNFRSTLIGRITTAGTISTFPGAMIGSTGIAASPFGSIWYVDWSAIPPGTCNWGIERLTTSGMTTCFKAPKVIYPQRITAGPDSAMWFTIGGLQDGKGYGIGRISKTGKITTYHLQDLAATIVAGPDRALWFTYPNNHAIGRITTSGKLTMYTDPGISPDVIAAGPDGALWFTNGNGAIGRITTRGQVTTYRGAFGVTKASVITAGPDGAMWFTNPANNTIGRITTIVTPAIFAKTPASGPPGTEVVITGRNLRHASQVTFNGTPAAIISDTATYVVAIVPHGAVTGRISVTTPAGTTSQNGWFTVTNPIPNAR